MKITVVAAILKDDSLTLVTNIGDYHKIPQGDARLRPILDQVLPVVTAGGSIEVDITRSDTNAFEDFEKKSNGVVRFFRIAREKLRHWFGADSLAVSDGTYGNIPDTVVEAAPVEEKREQTLEELIATAQPVTGLVFNTGTQTNELKEDETVIAVVDNKSVVANAENLHAQVVHANKIGSPLAFENFTRLVAAVPRQHSMEDLVKFIGKLDTPLTEDGYVLAYKNLKYTGTPGVYADPYTGKVKQGVGTRVCMHESLVDPNRGQDCSNGLHVASRSYLSGYHSGGGTFLIRIKPSDVIAVPKYNTNKMRVCAYDILGQLNDEDKRAVCSNQPLKSDEGKKMLAAAVAGRIPPMTKQSEITASMGGGVKYTDLNQSGFVVESTTEFEQDSLEDLGMVDPIDPEVASTVGPQAPVVPVAEVTEAVVKAGLSRKDQAKRFYDRWVELVKGDASDEEVKAAFDQMTAYKKACKVGWERLDIPTENGEPVVLVREVNDDGVDLTLATAGDRARAFEQATKAPRDDYEDSVELEEMYDDFMAGDSGSKAEYEAAVKLVTLFKESNFQFDEDGYCDDLNFEQSDYELAEEVISKWERSALEQKLAPKEQPAEAPQDESAPTPTGKAKSPRERIAELLAKGPLTIGTAKDIVAIKKSAKKGWSALGVNSDTAFDIEQQANIGEGNL
ncbi:rIIB lysis inhibitor [Xanthomonas virus PB119]|nr:rIIB lysis inhibitor [Xanthomonas virus PB119]